MQNQTLSAASSFSPVSKDLTLPQDLLPKTSTALFNLLAGFGLAFSPL